MGTVKEFNNFLNVDLINNIKKNVYENAESKWRSSLNWAPLIKGSSAIVLTFEIADNNFKNVIKNKFISFFPELKNKPMTVHYYLWPNLSFIPFHNDGGKYMGATIYLNEKWDKNHGGLFLYENKEEIKAIVPEFNKCVVNIFKINHATSLTTVEAPPRETLQIFFYENN
jgi:Rps23 Pro-64 3,4-dihydroxylase Tpa1-like proline 4-hydroxylase